MRDCHTIVGDRYVLVFGTEKAVFHFTLIQHAASAMDDETVFLQFFRKFRSACEFELQLFSGMLLKPGRKLFRTNVAALAVMGTAFRD